MRVILRALFTIPTPLCSYCIEEAMYILLQEVLVQLHVYVNFGLTSALNCEQNALAPLETRTRRCRVL